MRTWRSGGEIPTLLDRGKASEVNERGVWPQSEPVKPAQTTLGADDA
ncbi:MAG: hypothetical protein FWD59_08910 [Micrococcales bacterium]|nr:hypothetical protein [Micrococcales bacterium]